MEISKIPTGVEPPYDINVFIEIPQGGLPVKYELDKASGALFVNRFLHTTMFYPGNYGFIPNTLSEDGDACDALVVSQAAVIPGAVVRCRPIGALLMEDEAGRDEKIITVPVAALNPFYTGTNSYTDLPAILREQIQHFFRHYKDLEQGKWVKIVRWVGPDGAADLIMTAIERAKVKI
jgi:inorganic pyrophosphatase